MKMLRLIMLSIGIASLVPNYLLSVQRAVSLAIVDTTGREAALYSPIIDLAQEAGIAVEYFGIDAVMDEPDLLERLCEYDGVWGLYGIEFLRGMYTQSPVVHKVLRAMHGYSQLPGKLITFAFPPFAGKQHRNVVKDLAPILRSIGVNAMQVNPFIRPAFSVVPEELILDARARVQFFLYAVNHFLTHPLETEAKHYHTTLSLPQSLQASDMMDNIVGNVYMPHQFAQLPRSTDTFAKPYALYWLNPLHNNHVVVTTTTLCSFSGIAESFHLCPAAVAKRKKMLAKLAHVFSDVAGVMRRGVLTETNDVPVQPQPLAAIEKFGQGTVNSSNIKPLVRKAAWMEINVFQDKVYHKEVTDRQRRHDRTESIKRQQQLISYIIDAGLDTLWISFNPNMYYSPIAKSKKQEQHFITGVSRFTKQLVTAGNQSGKRVPQIFVGVEIANNLYPPNLPGNAAQDMYGTLYQDVPAPTDLAFWQHEVLHPLAAFVRKWQQPDVSHGVKLAGVMLDLEMYCRKKTNNFVTVMGFDQPTVEKFAKKHAYDSVPFGVHDVTQWLMKKGLAKKYFSFLEQQACAIGKQLRHEIQQLIPGAVIGSYTPMILPDWLYKGLWQGLSSAQEPMPLLTFNAEFNAHRHWFAANNIYVQHVSVLLLSKLRSHKHFGWIDDILKTHDGVWLNRFSRMVEDYDPASWTAIEQTPLSDQHKQDFVQYLGGAG